MPRVTAHFDFSGWFWIAGTLIVLGVLAFAWRKEIAVLVERVRQQNEVM